MTDGQMRPCITSCTYANANVNDHRPTPQCMKFDTITLPQIREITKHRTANKKVLLYYYHHHHHMNIKLTTHSQFSLLIHILRSEYSCKYIFHLHDQHFHIVNCHSLTYILTIKYNLCNSNSFIILCSPQNFLTRVYPFLTGAV